MLGDISLVDEIYIVCGYTDMRKSIDELCAIVENQLHMDPGVVHYIFSVEEDVNAPRPYFENLMFFLLYKKLAVEGKYRWPRNQLEVRQLTWKQFDWLMPDLILSGQKLLEIKLL